MNVVQFPKQITNTQIQREYTFCMDILTEKTKRLEDISNELESLNSKSVALGAEAAFIQQEISLVNLRLNNLIEVISGLQT